MCVLVGGRVHLIEGLKIHMQRELFGTEFCVDFAVVHVAANLVQIPYTGDLSEEHLQLST